MNGGALRTVRIQLLRVRHPGGHATVFPWCLSAGLSAYAPLGYPSTRSSTYSLGCTFGMPQRASIGESFHLFPQAYSLRESLGKELCIVQFPQSLALPIFLAASVSFSSVTNFPERFGVRPLPPHPVGGRLMSESGLSGSILCPRDRGSALGPCGLWAWPGVVV